MGTCAARIAQILRLIAPRIHEIAATGAAFPALADELADSGEGRVERLPGGGSQMAVATGMKTHIAPDAGLDTVIGALDGQPNIEATTGTPGGWRGKIIIRIISLMWRSRYWGGHHVSVWQPAQK